MPTVIRKGAEVDPDRGPSLDGEVQKNTDSHCNESTWLECSRPDTANRDNGVTLGRERAGRDLFPRVVA